MDTSVRVDVNGILATVAASIGTFVGVAWLCFLAGAAVVRLLDVSLAGVPDQAVTLTLVVVALGVTGWLEDGGFERLGADPDGGPRFAWLAIFFLPLAFSPLPVALRLLADSTSPFGAFVLGSTVLAGWLAFYGGLERLGLEPDDFVRVFGVALALGAVPVAAVVLLDVAWLTEAPIVVAIAVVVQCLALWVGLETVQNDREPSPG
ncbi:hypothetical protein CV102_11010 [Natronococcus pandeyae]|uniref:Uncharacterized protein n=1 Tax=Natronococcus pandeyae TaxID=2055836 RepID=A0A8J8Q3X4_9EURY|nr:hypothetical protein [Natronococcus pandeyae]TYL38337.1 hypothetical protein CV102_11010 [Natronococcus pandeyae]